MILPIYLYGQPVLRKETDDIEPDYPDLKKLVSDMFETMYHSDGVGLAAPQVGLPISMFVIDGNVLAENFPECKDLKMAVINPELEVIDDVPLVGREEGCLSVPGLSENVKRHEHIRLNWLDEDFVEHEQEFSGFASRIIQHEFDHLLGTIYTDRISPIRKQMIKSKLTNIAKGKVHCDYRTKAPVR
ncbi:MAG: peptide deformylase [Muribaculaceae bacterium]|nr:peptide deformylase [Muribaculaceae bacterium]